MSHYVESRRPARVVLLTECSMSDNIAARLTDVAFVRPCNLCPHMKRITLAKIRRALETNQHVITVARAAAIPLVGHGSCRTGIISCCDDFGRTFARSSCAVLK